SQDEVVASDQFIAELITSAPIAGYNTGAGGAGTHSVAAIRAGAQTLAYRQAATIDQKITALRNYIATAGVAVHNQAQVAAHNNSGVLNTNDTLDQALTAALSQDEVVASDQFIAELITSAP